MALYSSGAGPIFEKLMMEGRRTTDQELDALHLGENEQQIRKMSEEMVTRNVSGSTIKLC